MNCDDCQNWLAGAETVVDPGVESHLAECSVCQSFRAALEQLDAELTQHAARVNLPADFDSQVISRTIGNRSDLSPERIASLRAEWEREYVERLAAVSPWKLFRQPMFYLRTAALASLAVAGYWLVPEMVSALAAGMDAATFPTINLAGASALGAAGLGLFCVLAVRSRGSELAADWIADVVQFPAAQWEPVQE